MDYSAYSASTASPAYTSYSTGYAPVSSSAAYYQVSGSATGSGYATSGATTGYYGQQDAWLGSSDPEAYDASAEYYYQDDQGYGPTSGP